MSWPAEDDNCAHMADDGCCARTTPHLFDKVNGFSTIILGRTAQIIYDHKLIAESL